MKSSLPSVILLSPRNRRIRLGAIESPMAPLACDTIPLTLALILQLRVTATPD